MYSSKQMTNNVTNLSNSPSREASIIGCLRSCYLYMLDAVFFSTQPFQAKTFYYTVITYLHGIRLSINCPELFLCGRQLRCSIVLK